MSGILVNGLELRIRGLNCCSNSFWVLMLNPVPILPVYLSFFPSNTPTKSELNGLLDPSFLVNPPITTSWRLLALIFNHSLDRLAGQINTVVSLGDYAFKAQFPGCFESFYSRHIEIFAQANDFIGGRKN